jgi:hypothetical protein
MPRPLSDNLGYAILFIVKNHRLGAIASQNCAFLSYFALKIASIWPVIRPAYLGQDQVRTATSRALPWPRGRVYGPRSTARLDLSAFANRPQSRARAQVAL